MDRRTPPHAGAIPFSPAALLPRGPTPAPHTSTPTHPPKTTTIEAHVTQDGPPTRHLRFVNDEPPFDPDYDVRRPPQDDDAERACLGAMLLAPTAIDDVTALITPADHYRPAHETIHQVIVDMHASGQSIDAITVAHELARRPADRGRTQLDVVGGAPYLHTLTADVPIVANAAHYAGIVLEKAKLRTLVTEGNRLINLGYAGNLEKADHYLGDAVEHINDAVMRFGTAPTGPSAWAPLDLTAVLNGEEVDPPPILLERSDGAHMLYDGAVHTFSGEPGSGKTWILLIAAVQQLAAGHTVTMIDFEDRASRVVARLLALGATPPQVRDHFHYLRPRNALDAATRHDLDAATRGSSLVILDGVTEAMTLHGLDLNANADVATFYDLLPRHIADTSGAAVALIDHVVKDGEKQGRWALGGQHKLAGIDGVAYLVKAIEPFGRGKTGHARITVSKDRPGYIEELALGRTVAELYLDATDVNILRHRLEPPTAIAKDEAGNMRPTHLMERVSRYVEITPGLGKKELLDGRISGKTAYLRRAFDRLIQEGYMEVATGPNRKQIHRIVTPYREDEDGMHTNPGWADQEALS